MPNHKTQSVCFEDLKVDDPVIIRDRDHNADGARGTVYFLNPESQMVSVVTKGYTDIWEGYADGLVKIIEG